MSQLFIQVRRRIVILNCQKQFDSFLDLEDLHFWCHLNGPNQQIVFYWANLTASDYSNLTIFSVTEQNRMSMITSCDPYLPNGTCSTKQFRLEAGREYHIVARLKKVLPNYNGQKNGTCHVRTGNSHQLVDIRKTISLTTDLSPISIETIRHEFVNRTAVRFMWLDHPFDVQARLRNLESNSVKTPIENTRRMALFTNLTSGSIYRLELNISQINWPIFLQTTDYHIQTGTITDKKKKTANQSSISLDVDKPMITQILRKSDSTLIVLVTEPDSSSLGFLYCIQLFRENSPKNCSTSNVFNQLQPASIYNVSVINRRDPYENLFIWSEQITFKLVNTSESK